MRRRKQKKHGEPRRYNLKMIRDFLDHLLWEYKVQHFEFLGGCDLTKRKINPELVDQLGKYARRYGTILLPIGEVVDSGQIEPEINELLLNRAQDRIDILEMASEIADHSLKCAAWCYQHNPRGGLVRVPEWSLDDLRQILRENDE